MFNPHLHSSKLGEVELTDWHLKVLATTDWVRVGINGALAQSELYAESGRVGDVTDKVLRTEGAHWDVIEDPDNGWVLFQSLQLYIQRDYPSAPSVRFKVAVGWKGLDEYLTVDADSPIFVSFWDCDMEHDVFGGEFVKGQVAPIRTDDFTFGVTRYNQNQTRADGVTLVGVNITL